VDTGQDAGSRDAGFASDALIEASDVPAFDATSVDAGHRDADPIDAETPDVPADAMPADAIAADVQRPDVMLEPYGDLVLSDAPAAYWRLGELNGPAADVIGMHPGEYFSHPAGACVRNVSGPSADGASDLSRGCFVSAGDAFDFTGTASFTLECWVRRSIGEDPDPLWRTVIGKTEGCGGAREGYAIEVSDLEGGLVRFVRHQGARITAVDSLSLPQDVWRHVAAVYDGSTRAMTLYVGGDLVSRVDEPSTALLDTVAPFSIGDDDPSCAFRGAIDECAVYDRALPANRVSAHASFW
jgi:large repetitive protein